METPAADGSGRSTYLDGYAAAERLREVDEEAFGTLKATVFEYRCMDGEMGWHLEARGPVIEVDPYDGRTVVGIRHNDLDRLPPRPPASVVDSGATDAWYAEVYRALAAWDELLNEDGRRLTISLQSGDCTLVHNRRVMHGRESFNLKEGDAKRSIVGCYTGSDDLESRWRVCFTSRD